MAHFRIYLNMKKSNAGQTFSTCMIRSNKPYGSDNSLVSFFVPSELVKSKGLLSRCAVPTVPWLNSAHFQPRSSIVLVRKHVTMKTQIALRTKLHT